MDIGSRKAVIEMKRRDVEKEEFDFEERDALACNLLSLSAAQIEAGDTEGALQALREAEQQLLLITQNPFFQHTVEVHGSRIEVLLAAVYYNLSVLYYEARDAQNGYEFLQHSRAKVCQLTEKAKAREGQLYETFTSALDLLGKAVRA